MIWQPALPDRYLTMSDAELASAINARRKQLGSVFGRTGPWPQGVTAEQRPEALSIAQLIALWRLHG